jgi:acetone carboxylase gamma subunit
MTDKFISADPQNKSFDENTEQIDIDLIEWNDYNDNICPQCNQDHSYKITAGSTIFDMISFFDRDTSREI